MKKLFLIVLVIRLLLSFLPAMQIDMGAWQAWAMRMVEVGPQNFYSTKIFTDNPPGYLYIFWAIGGIWQWLGSLGALGGFWGGNGFEWLLKLPANLFDLGTGLLIYKIIKGKMGEKGNWGKWGFLLYTLNPAIWFNSSVFGQFDGAGAFFGLLAVYLILEKKRIEWSAVALAIAWAIKPQAIALGPAIGILMIREVWGVGWVRAAGRAISAAGIFILTTLFLYWPFFPENPLAGVFYVFSRMNNIYFCTTCFTFNFWGIFGNWLDDRVLFLGLPLLIWGIILGGLGMLGVLGMLGRLWKAREKVYLAISLSVLAFNMLVTRMHERYVLPFFAFFLIAVILLKSKKLMLFYIFFSFFNLLNVYYPYATYNTNLHLTPGLVIWLGENFRFLSMVGFGSFLVLLGWYWRGLLMVDAGPVACSSRPTCSPSAALARRDALRARHPLIENRTKDLFWSKKEIIIVFLLVFVSFLIRVIRLDIPKTYYFDEVYHAFTAVELEKGNKMAWEWWNTPPQGFAYEWTHPPLAKEMMVLGIRGIRWIRGFEGFGGDGDAFGWRFPGVLAGVGVIFLIYLLGRNLFNKRAGFIAAFLASFDGLLFTQSRIGMNDIYFLFFILLAFYLFVRTIGQIRKIGLIGVGIALGLSLASKWTAIYGIGILGGLYIINFASGFSRSLLAETPDVHRGARRDLTKTVVVFFFIFLLIPVSVYLLTYFPFFQSRHTWVQFNELQHQMWWYHTGLKATHPYTSPWYSWPFLQRPVWYYVNYNKGTVANIYGLGNPLVWWAGLGAIGWIIIILLRRLAKVAHAIFSGTKPFEDSPDVTSGSFRSSKIGDLPASLFIVLLGYFGFFLPWAFSPRIMFLYHYLPSLPFLCLGLGWGLERIWQIGIIGQIGSIKITGKLLTFAFLLLTFLTFLYFYPQLAAWPVSKAWSEQYFWFASWR